MNLAPLNAQLRWHTEADFPQIAAVEAQSFDEPLSEKELRTMASNRHPPVVGLVAEVGRTLVGFVFYELYKSRIELLNFAVPPDSRRRGVGRLLLGKLKEFLSAHRRSRIVAMVRETNLDVQLFLKACDFKAVGVKRDWFENREDAFEFEYRVGDGERDEVAETVIAGGPVAAR